MVLADGTTAHIRPIAPNDGDALQAFHLGLSDQSRYMRFFTAKPRLSDAMIEHFVTVDFHDRLTLMAEIGSRLAAVASYERDGDSDGAEVAFVVADEDQGRGLGTVLLEHLAADARERGITRFTADTLATNRQMLGVFRSAGFAERTHLEHGVVEVELLIEPSPAAQAAMEQREHRAEAASIARLLMPRSVAVVGASRSAQNVGHQVLRNLLAGNFDGPVYPVNPGSPHVASVPAYPSVTAIPGPVDLAVIAVPAPAVAAVLEECGAKGVKGVVVLSAGFGEVGEGDGEAQLRHLARRHSFRLVGPNCIGLVNTAIGPRRHLLPLPAGGRPGGHAVAVGGHRDRHPGAVAAARARRVGLRVGGQQGRRQLQRPAPVLGGRPRHRRGAALPGVVRQPPQVRPDRPPGVSAQADRGGEERAHAGGGAGRVVAHGRHGQPRHRGRRPVPPDRGDPGRHPGGAVRHGPGARLPAPAGREPGGHRGQLGRARDPGHRRLRGRRAGGADDLASPPSRPSRAILDPKAATANPVDLVAGATPEHYRQATELLLADDGIDAVLVICTPTFAAPPRQVAATVATVVATAGVPAAPAVTTTTATGDGSTGDGSTGDGAAVVDATGPEPGPSAKPVVVSFLAWPDMPALLRADTPPAGASPTVAVPAFSSPEAAVRALGRAAAYAEWRRRPPGRVRQLDRFDIDRAADVIADGLAAAPAGGWLPPEQVWDVLESVGIATARTVAVTSADEAATVAAGVGFPVVLKASGPDLVHKSDVGGVALDLADEGAVRVAWADMAARIGERMTGGVVQAMAASGTETIVGVVQDPVFGPLVMFGLGGVATELLGDRSFRVLPLTDADAADLVRSLRASPLLFGYRGAAPADTDALEDLLERVARLAGHHDDRGAEIAELDLNPVIVGPSGAVVVDARIRVAATPGGPPLDVRRMTDRARPGA